MSTDMTVEEHGTPAAYRLHRKRDEEPCADCRRSLADYMRQYRAAHPNYLRRSKRMDKVRLRALTVLARQHPDDFQRIYDQAIRDEFGIGS